MAGVSLAIQSEDNDRHNDDCQDQSSSKNEFGGKLVYFLADACLKSAPGDH